MKNYFEDIYIEQYLMSEFTFGFELEGYLEEDYDKDDIYRLWEDYASTIRSQISGDADIKDDGSLSDYGYNIPFELASHIIKFNPLTIGTVIKFLNDATRFIYTDETCGFHIHIGFPEKDKKYLGPMMLWVLLNLIVNNNQTDMLKEILYFKEYKMYESTYALFNFLLKAKSDLQESFYNNKEFSKEDIYNTLLYIYDGEKYRILRIHPQGTLEWRGARSFMDDGKISIIREFFNKKLYPFVKWITNTLNKDFIIVNGIKITKVEFYKKIMTYNSPVELKKENIFNHNAPMNQLRTVFYNFKWARTSNNVKYKEAYIDIVNDKFTLCLGIVYNINIPEGYLYNGKIINSKINDITILDSDHMSVLRNDIKHFVNNSEDSFISPSIINSSIDNIKAKTKSMLNLEDCIIAKGIFEGEKEKISISSCSIDYGSFIGCKLINNSIDNASNIIDCFISKTNFGSGTYFSNCHIYYNEAFYKGTFKDCNITSVNFYEDVKIIDSDIGNSKFFGTDIKKSQTTSCFYYGLNISKEDEIIINKPNNLKDCILKDFIIDFENDSTNIDNSKFINCHFIEIDFDDGRYEAGIDFKNCTFENCHNIETALKYIEEGILTIFIDDEEIKDEEILMQMLENKSEDYDN